MVYINRVLIFVEYFERQSRLYKAKDHVSLCVMDTAPFHFCDSVGFYIRSDGDKARVLRDLAESYRVQPVQQGRITRYKAHVAGALRRNGRYLASLCTSGSAGHHLIFLTRVDFAGVCILVERRLRGDAFYPRMVLIRMSFHDALFDDTVLDGELVKVPGENGRWTFLVSDVLVHSGRRLACNLTQRLQVAERIVRDDGYLDDHDPFVLAVMPHFPVAQLRSVLSQPYKFGAVRGVRFKATSRSIDGNDILFMLPTTTKSVRSSRGGHNRDDGDQDTPEDGDHDTPEDGDHDTPEDGDHDTPEDGDHDTPEDGDHDTPEDGDHDTPEDGDHDTPDDGDHDNHEESEHDTDDTDSTTTLTTTVITPIVYTAFYTRRTSMPDVYELWSDRSHVGLCAAVNVAGVPSMLASRMMHAAFADVKDDVLAVKLLVFEHNSRLNKWVIAL